MSTDMDCIPWPILLWSLSVTPDKYQHTSSVSWRHYVVYSGVLRSSWLRKWKLESSGVCRGALASMASILSENLFPLSSWQNRTPTPASSHLSENTKLLTHYFTAQCPQSHCGSSQCPHRPFRSSQCPHKHRGYSQFAHRHCGYSQCPQRRCGCSFCPQKHWIPYSLWSDACRQLLPRSQVTGASPL